MSKETSRGKLEGQKQRERILGKGQLHQQTAGEKQQFWQLTPTLLVKRGDQEGDNGK